MRLAIGSILTTLLVTYVLVSVVGQVLDGQVWQAALGVALAGLLIWVFRERA